MTFYELMFDVFLTFVGDPWEAPGEALGLMKRSFVTRCRMSCSTCFWLIKEASETIFNNFWNSREPRHVMLGGGAHRVGLGVGL